MKNLINKEEIIPNINIGQAYDRRYKDADIHYEVLGNLANFFGRTMTTHRHDRYFQMHYVKSGMTHVCLGEQQYQANAPLFFITPPAVPHSFVTEEGNDGHVLTVRQQVIWAILDEMPELITRFKTTPVCIAINNLPVSLQKEVQYLEHLLDRLRDENNHFYLGKLPTLQSLVKLTFISLFRLADNSTETAIKPIQYEALQLFRVFTELLETQYKQHLTLKDYANVMAITEAKLNEICRQIGNLSPKQLILDRIMQEAKYLLLFTEHSVMDIGYQLGFQDPAYFSRFFTRQAKVTPKAYRLAMANKPYRQYFMR